MGAFGELLIKTWGGDLDRYRGNYESKPKTKVVETTETDKAKYRYEYKISKARERLNILTNNLMYRPQDVKNYTEDSIKGGFRQLGFDENIQNIIWSEYSEFISKCVLK
jgi:hypothetical protein